MHTIRPHTPTHQDSFYYMPTQLYWRSKNTHSHTYLYDDNRSLQP